MYLEEIKNHDMIMIAKLDAPGSLGRVTGSDFQRREKNQSNWWNILMQVELLSFKRAARFQRSNRLLTKKT